MQSKTEFYAGLDSNLTSNKSFPDNERELLNTHLSKEEYEVLYGR